MPARSRSTRVLAGIFVTLALCTASPGSAAGDEGAPPKRQPGSWTTTVEVTNVVGKDPDQTKERLNRQFAALADMSVCITPEIVATEDPVDDAAKAFAGTCTYTDKDLSGSTVSLSGICKNNDERVRLRLTGTMNPTAQDFTISLSDADDGRAKALEMKAHMRRNGNCTAKDIKLPPPDK